MMIKRRSLSVGCCSVLVAMSVGDVCAQRAVGQTLAGSGAVSRTDAYGNAVPRYEQRRSVGSFQNPFQQGALRGYQNAGRRAYRRGGLAPFSFSADRARASFAANAYARRATNTRLGFSIPNPLANLAGTSPTVQRAFAQYGGFGYRSGSGGPGEITMVLTRLHTMVQANALDAPLQRGVWDRSPSGGVLPRSVSAMAVGFEPVPAPDPSPDAIPLADSLRERTSRSFTQFRVEGWERFKEGEYRRAARAFEAIIAVDSKDYEARLGECFAHLSLGAMRTSATLVVTWARRDPDLFLLTVNMTERYGDEADIRALLLRAQLFAQANADASSAQALYVLSLWYLGDRDQAATMAAKLARDHPDSAYADWPAKVRAALDVSDDGHADTSGVGG